MTKADYELILNSFGQKLKQLATGYRNQPEADTPLKQVIISAFRANPWFTPANILMAMENWAVALDKEKVEQWLASYTIQVNRPKTIGVINAGNIPFVGLHDLLSVVVSGHTYLGKNASDDNTLLPFAASLITEIAPSLKPSIRFTEQMKGMDAVIATGSNNSARYFEYYFGKYPHIIRRNRNGIAVLTGKESEAELKLLGNDIFTYFGLGCRNVSKLYVPENYSFNTFFESIYDQNEVMNHNKYMNNFDYNNSILLLKQIPFLQNGFLIVMEDERIASPISMLHFEYYSDLKTVEKSLSEKTDQIQCIVSKDKLFTDPLLTKINIPFGTTQKPELWDYADGVDTIMELEKW